MTAPDVVERLQRLERRLGALETEHFALTEQVRRVGETADRAAGGLDELEEILTDVTVDNAERADAMDRAMAQRQTQLDAEVEVVPAPGSELAPLLGVTGVPAVSAGGDSGQAADGGIDAPDIAVLHAWVQTHIAPLVRKTTTSGEGAGIRWCRRWWEHVDAVERFIALYLAYHALAEEESPTWLSVYLRDHLDPHLATLTSPYGPFYLCHPRHHSDASEALGQAELHAAQPRETTP
ncbi:DUF4913 domain-containing protein [Saccharothrix sp.]|uniref:DUF4913 domain-containing protein n=1 Tax=Saccharothrix sp. TaxID=1873460 RepID=UPI002812005A|nr:DUF4913 domain-containing protein [Saccharothrix sp.]